MGRATFTPFVMNFSFRASAAFDFGPGGTATIYGPRSSFVVRLAMVSRLGPRDGTPGPNKGTDGQDYRLTTRTRAITRRLDLLCPARSPPARRRAAPSRWQSLAGARRCAP